MIKRYKARPKVIQAAMITEDKLQDLATWCGGTVSSPHMEDGKKSIFIPTLEGTMEGQLGDFIVKGIADEFYPVKPEIFANSYDEMPE